MPNEEPLPKAIIDLAGTERVVIYDVSPSDRPSRLAPTSPFLLGGPSWWRFVRRRKELDDGWFTLLIPLRPLSEDEALLAVDWGTLFANAFLLVEPKHEINLPALARQSLQDLRAAFGIWRYWRLKPDGTREYCAETLDLARHKTIVEDQQERLPRTFPPESLRSGLMNLNLKEADLFIGRPLERVVTPFLTRLGLPIPHDPAILVEGMRDLVNIGLAWVEDRADGGKVYHGKDQPLPDDVPIERLRRMVRI